MPYGDVPLLSLADTSTLLGLIHDRVGEINVGTHYAGKGDVRLVLRIGFRRAGVP